MEQSTQRVQELGHSRRGSLHRPTKDLQHRLEKASQIQPRQERLRPY